MKPLKFLLTGAYFGLLIVKSDALNWFRIQEMFRFQAIYMFGLFATAIAVGGITVILIRRFGLVTFAGAPIRLAHKPLHWKAQVGGGLLFGFGWVLCGQCVAPIFALLGTGYTAALLILAGALLGVLAYGASKSILPH